MRIIFVRHGHPNYMDDCLTGLGQLQAEATAKRLSYEKIDKIYSSSCGRAYETAEYIAAVHGLGIEKLDFMREIGWGSVDDETIIHNGHPWHTADEMASCGQSLMNIHWDKAEPYCRNKVVSYVKNVGENFDCLLASLGYRREGEFYRVGDPVYDNVLLASHGGSSSAVLSHIFNLPFSFICGAVRPDFTSITIIDFHGKEGCIISPHIELLNDARHISGIEAEKGFGR